MDRQKSPATAASITRIAGDGYTPNATSSIISAASAAASNQPGRDAVSRPAAPSSSSAAACA
jgi:hypothetical protein